MRRHSATAPRADGALFEAGRDLVARRVCYERDPFTRLDGETCIDGVMGTRQQFRRMGTEGHPFNFTSPPQVLRPCPHRCGALGDRAHGYVGLPDEDDGSAHQRSHADDPRRDSQGLEKDRR